MSFLGNVLKRPDFLQPRRGELKQRRFEASSPQNPVTDAVSLTNTVTQGERVISHQESAVVQLRNGTSLRGDGTQVEVAGPSGTSSSFPGSIEVDAGQVTIANETTGAQQSFRPDGSSMLFDNGVIAQIAPDGQAVSILPGGVHGVNGTVLEGKVQMADGATLEPVLKQEWLLAD